MSALQNPKHALITSCLNVKANANSSMPYDNTHTLLPGTLYLIA